MPEAKDEGVMPANDPFPSKGINGLPPISPPALSLEEASQAAAELQAFRTLETRSSRKRRSTHMLIMAIILGAVLLVLVIGFVILNNLFNSPNTGVSLPTDIVWRGDYVETIKGSGTVEAYESVVVTPEIDGTVAELYVAEGDIVVAGQVLFTIDAPDLDSQIRAAQRGVDSANLAVSNAVAMRDEASLAQKRAYDAYLSLPEAIDRARAAALAAGEPFDEERARQELDAALAAYEGTRAQARAAQQQLDGTYLQLTEAQEALSRTSAYKEKCTVTAPVSGQVVTLSIERGMKLSTLATSGLSPLRIADLSRMRVTLNINEVDIAKLQVGQKATVSFSALSDYQATASVIRIAAVSTGREMDAWSGGFGIVTFPVEILIETPDPRLKIGMSAQAEVLVDQRENVLLVSAIALQEQQEGSAVIEVQDPDGTTRRVPVTVLARNDNVAAIEGSVNPGDVVLLGKDYVASSGDMDGRMAGSSGIVIRSG